MDWRVGLLTLAAAANALGGCASSAESDTPEASVTVRLVISDGNIRPPDVPCTGAGAFRYAHPEASYVIKDADGRTVASGSLPQGTSEKAWNLDLGDREQPTVCVMMLEVAGVDSVKHATLSIDARPPKPIRPDRSMDDIPEVVLK
jgi:hypothetical protein